MSAKIRVVLDRNELEIEPGQQGDVLVTVQNFSKIVDQYTITVDGLDPSWVSIPTTELSLFPQDQESVHITVQPPAGAAARAGRYDLMVRVSSRQSPADRTSVPLTLHILPVTAFELSLRPQRQTVRGSATYQVIITNPGNDDLVFSFTASDPEDACTYRFHPQRATVRAGSQGAVSLTVTPKQVTREAGRYDFTVVATPEGVPSQAQQVNGELLQPQPPSLSRWTIVLGGLAALLCCVVAVIAAVTILPNLSGRATPPVALTTPTPTTEAPTLTPTIEEPSPTPAVETTTPAPALLPDLAIGEMTFPPSIVAGVEADFTVVVANRGSGNSAPCTLQAQFQPSGIVQQAEVPALNAGTVANVLLRVTLDHPGTHSINLVVDSLGVVEESDEDNNSLARPFDIGVPPRPDLVVTALSVDPSSPHMCQLATVRLTIQNRGSADAGPFKWQWLSAGPTVGLEGTASGLAAGASLDVEGIYWYGGWSNYTTTAIADVAESVAESDETNNTRILNVSVKSTALIVFDAFPDGTPINSDVLLSGNEFADWDITLSAVPQGSYGAGMVPAIRTPGYGGTTANFLTAGKADVRVGAIPIAIAFDPPVSRVIIHFRGASVDYTLEAYDSSNTLVDSATKAAVFGGDSVRVQVSLQDRIITRVVFGHTAASTIIEAIEFQ
jgi:hypothetical protein